MATELPVINLLNRIYTYLGTSKNGSEWQICQLARTRMFLEVGK